MHIKSILLLVASLSIGSSYAKPTAKTNYPLIKNAKRKVIDKDLPDPGCNAEGIIYTTKKDGYKKNRLLFVNSHSQKGRKNLVLSLSYDDGRTWTHKKCIEKGASGYSAITICKNGDIGIFFENGKKMTFVRVTLEDLTDGKDKLSKPFEL